VYTSIPAQDADLFVFAEPLGHFQRRLNANDLPLREGQAQQFQGRFAGRIAGHDQGLCPAGKQKAADGQGALADEIAALAAVGAMGRIGEIDHVFKGQDATRRLHDRQAADARIKKTDRRRQRIFFVLFFVHDFQGDYIPTPCFWLFLSAAKNI
jgi:hypothetical protein